MRENNRYLSNHKLIELICFNLKKQTTITDKVKRKRVKDWVLYDEEFNKEVSSLLTSTIKSNNPSWWQFVDSYYKLEKKWISKYYNKGKESTIGFLYRTKNSLRKQREKWFSKMFPSTPKTFRLQKLIDSKNGRADSLEATKFANELYKGSVLKAYDNKGHKVFKVERKTIINKIKKLRNTVTPGPSGISAILLKKHNELVSELLEIVFNQLLKKRITKRWKQGYINWIPKEENADPKDISKWRPITLLNLEWKLFTSIVKDELENAATNIIGKYQIGFVKERWIHENLFIMNRIITGYQEKKKKGFAITTDFHKAYDSILHEAIIKRVNKLYGGEWASLINNIIVEGESQVIWGGIIYPSKIEINRGVRQGDSLSPLLFNIVMGKLLTKMDKIKTNGNYWEKVKYIAFADDLVCFCKSIDEVKERLNTIIKVSASVGLSLNVNKSYIFKLGKNNRIKKVENIKCVSKIRFLGISIDNKGKINWNHSIIKMINRIQVIKRIFSHSHLRHKIILLNSYCLSICNYSELAVKLEEPGLLYTIKCIFDLI